MQQCAASAKLWHSKQLVAFTQTAMLCNQSSLNNYGERSPNGGINIAVTACRTLCKAVVNP
jgi:hypothetical protein